jgi:hypothetical protein
MICPFKNITKTEHIYDSMSQLIHTITFEDFAPCYGEDCPYFIYQTPTTNKVSAGMLIPLKGICTKIK